MTSKPKQQWEISETNRIEFLVEKKLYLSGVGINSLKDALDGFILHFRGFLCELKWPNAHDVLTGRRLEPKLNLTLGLRFAGDFGVVDEAVAGPCIGRQLAGARELQALDDGGFSGAVGADD